MRTNNNQTYKDPVEQKLSMFENLFQTYYNSLLAYAYKKVNDKQAAEDVVQDVFMALWIKHDSIDFNTSIKPYLYKAVYNRSITYLNSMINSLDITEHDIDMSLHNAIILYDQQDSLLLKEVSEEVARFIETLPTQCKKVFKLSREEYLKNKEIALILNLSEKTVEDHLRRALKGLRSHLIKSGFLPFTTFYIINLSLC